MLIILTYLVVVQLIPSNSLEGEFFCTDGAPRVWCLPEDYKMAKHPFLFSNLVNKTLPMSYDLEFVVDEVTNVNDKAQTLTLAMYFGVVWIEPRLVINESANEWTEFKFGPQDEVNVLPEAIQNFWYPDLEIYGLENFNRLKVLKEMSGLRINKNRSITYETRVLVTISCKMRFDNYPLDSHNCAMMVGSYYDTDDTVQCSSKITYKEKRQRNLQHFVEIEELAEERRKIKLPSGDYSACGFQVKLQRKIMQLLVQVYLPGFMFVVVSWISFLVKPDIVPGRMALLVTLFLVLISIFNSVRERAPYSHGMNAVDLYLVVCIILVFLALMEYGLILYLLLKRKTPKYMIAHIRYSLGKEVHFQNSEESESPTGPWATSLKRRLSRVPRLKSSCAPSTAELCHDIDVCSFYIAGPVFLLFNLAYWVTYLNYDEFTVQKSNFNLA